MSSIYQKKRETGKKYGDDEADLEADVMAWPSFKFATHASRTIQSWGQGQWKILVLCQLLVLLGKELWELTLRTRMRKTDIQTQEGERYKYNMYRVQVGKQRKETLQHWC